MTNRRKKTNLKQGLSQSGLDVLLQSENRVDVKTETEVNVEARIRQLLVVVRRQTADLVVQPREDEMAAFNAGQAEENGVAGRYLEMFHHQLQCNVI